MKNPMMQALLCLCSSWGSRNLVKDFVWVTELVNNESWTQVCCLKPVFSTTQPKMHRQMWILYCAVSSGQLGDAASSGSSCAFLTRPPREMAKSSALIPQVRTQVQRCDMTCQESQAPEQKIKSVWYSTKEMQVMGDSIFPTLVCFDDLCLE